MMPETDIKNLDPKYIYKLCENCKLYWQLSKTVTRCQKCAKIMEKTVRLAKDGKSIEEINK